LDGTVNLTNLDFMESTQDLKYDKQAVIVSRCGYTGEDGFELSLPNSVIESFMDDLWVPKESDGQ